MRWKKWQNDSGKRTNRPPEAVSSRSSLHGQALIWASESLDSNLSLLESGGSKPSAGEGGGSYSRPPSPTASTQSLQDAVYLRTTSASEEVVSTHLRGQASPSQPLNQSILPAPHCTWRPNLASSWPLEVHVFSNINKSHLNSTLCLKCDFSQFHLIHRTCVLKRQDRYWYN